jgi:hypothetical protein
MKRAPGSHDLGQNRTPSNRKMSRRDGIYSRVSPQVRLGPLPTRVVLLLAAAAMAPGFVAAFARDGSQLATADDPTWAFQSLRDISVPVVPDDSWCRTPIDRFILAKLNEKGIKPNAPIDRRKLARRAYFDLVGLPPAWDDIDQFVHDPAGDAYERLIVRLLENSHYGERWGRHWLDLARFAESHGYEQDYDRPNAYHYRDFVIKALNSDMPYDQFVKWQIAGDELAPKDPLALMATGFLAAGTHATQITANQAEKERYDELDDIVRTIGTSMLGITIACARCHDHKFDPIPTADYYKLISTFSTTVRSDYDVDLDPQWYEAAKAAFDAEHAPLVAARERFEREQLPARFEEYRKSHPELRPQFPWIRIEPSEVKSAGGATFTRQPDGSQLVSGANPDHDVYTVLVSTKCSDIRAIRLEALADPSLSKGGPGRAPNGNFGLTEVRVTAAPLDAAAGASGSPTNGVAPVAVKLANARSSFDQNGLPVAHAIDDKKDTCWAVDPQFGKDHAAVFEFESPVGFEGGTRLTVTLEFSCNKQHGMGRIRLAASTLEHPPIEGRPIGEGAASVLAMLDKDPAANLSEAQRADALEAYRTLDSDWQQLNARIEEHAAGMPTPKMSKVLISSENVPAVRLHTQGLDFYDPVYQLKRGDPNQKGEVVAQGFLRSLVRSPDGDKTWQEAPPPGCRTSLRRQALANWLTDVDSGAGHLLARVIVNRLWYHHMGRGIVATPSDFGKQGERPSHPELLDWLAAELVKHDWKLSHIHKLIMTSAVYMQSSAIDDERLAADRDNTLFWHRPGRRLEAEVIRDSMLASSGALDGTMFGPGTMDANQRRRSIYFFVKRSQLVPMMTLFDGPDTLQDLPCRASTTIAPQALMLLNNAAVRAHAAAMARRIDWSGDPSHGVVSGFQIALSRPPTDSERAAATEFINAQAADYARAGRADARDLAATDFCQALLCLNEFVYVE